MTQRSMDCRSARKLVTAGRATGGAARRHVEKCADCARYARRLASVERALGRHHAGATPPPGFAATVRRRLPRGGDPLGWAALRLLPATLGLILLLSWLNLRAPAAEAAVDAADPTAAVVTWVLDPDVDVGTELDSELESGS